MSDFTIVLVTQDDDVEAVRDLCRAFVDWQIEEFPDKAEVIRTYFAPERYEPTLRDLPAVHARPDGGILLAQKNGAPLGCVMWQPFEQGIAEVKRLFVLPEAHGTGLGRALMTELEDQARQGGYTALILETAVFLDAAKGLYRSLGFSDPPADYADNYQSPASIGLYKPLTQA